MMMSSTRPYFLRAIYDWIVDNDATPFLVVDAQVADVLVPREHVKDGEITLNIAPQAVAQLQMNNHAVDFSARFNGRSQAIHVPMEAVLGIFAQENGQGMAFPPEEVFESDEHDVMETGRMIDDEPPTPPKPKRSRAHLQVVK